MTDRMNVPTAATPIGGSSPAGTASGHPAGTAAAGSTRLAVSGLVARGFGPPEAGNLAALAAGLWPARTGWAVSEIEHLRFLRAIVREGRLEA